MSTDGGTSTPAPALSDLSLVQSLQDIQGTTSHPLALSPRFQADSLAYSTTVAKGAVLVYARLNSAEADVSLEFDGLQVAQELAVDGTSLFRLAVTASGIVHVNVMGSDRKTTWQYSIRLILDPSKDPLLKDLPKLKAMSLKQAYMSRYTSFAPRPLSPEFHPDSTFYTSAEDGKQEMRLTVEPVAADDLVSVSFNGVKLEPLPGQTGAMEFSAQFDTHGVFKTVLKRPFDGKERTYLLTLDNLPPVNTGKWVSYPIPAEMFRSMEFISESVGFADDHYNGIYKTVDAGRSWKKQSRITDPGTFVIDFIDPDNGYAADYSGLLLRTGDGGKTWTKRPAFDNHAMAVHSFPTPQIGYFAERDSVFKTSDGGMTWVNKPTNLFNAYLSTIKFLDPLRGFLIDGYGKLLKTSNGGDTWEIIFDNGNAGGFFGSLDVLDSSTLSFESDAGKFLTQDAGRTWTPLKVPKDLRIREVKFTGPEVGYLIATPTSSGESLMKTTDGGNTWITQYHGAGDFTGFAFGPSGAGVALTYGNAIWVLNK